ncbi:hypothetical protein LIA77_06246 [Sarocladium implicatum]|nr:hypothetical protein LIA77_06246 [Sarocladium implicatum]
MLCDSAWWSCGDGSVVGERMEGWIPDSGDIDPVLSRVEALLCGMSLYELLMRIVVDAYDNSCRDV